MKQNVIAGLTRNPHNPTIIAGATRNPLIAIALLFAIQCLFSCNHTPNPAGIETALVLPDTVFASKSDSLEGTSKNLIILF